MSELEKVIAKIDHTHLGYEDHGIFSLTLGFDFGGFHQGLGGYCVCSPKSDNPNDAAGIRLVKAIVDACGVDRWEDLNGRIVYVLKEPGWSGMIRGIENPPTEKGRRVIFADIFEVLS